MAAEYCCEEAGRHRHVQSWRMFIVENRMFSAAKRGKAKDDDKEPFKGKPAQRFELRRELYANDEVHLSPVGNQVLGNILRWQVKNESEELESGPREEVTMMIKAEKKGDGETKMVTLTGKFKF